MAIESTDNSILKPNVVLKTNAEGALILDELVIGGTGNETGITVELEVIDTARFHGPLIAEGGVMLFSDDATVTLERVVIDGIPCLVGRRS